MTFTIIGFLASYKLVVHNIKVQCSKLLIKFIDLLNMTNRAKIHEFYKKEKREFLFFKAQFSNLSG